MRLTRLSPDFAIELFRAAAGNRQCVPLVAGMEPSQLDDLPDVVTRVAQRP